MDLTVRSKKMAKKNSLKKLINEFTIGGFVNGYRQQSNHQIKLDKGWAHIVNERDDEGKAIRNEGPSYEYAPYMKKIEKAENMQAKEVNALVKLLQSKGLTKEATLLGAKYMKGMRDFNDTLKKLYRKLT